MVKELVKMDLKRIWFLIAINSFIVIVCGGITGYNIMMLIQGILVISGFLADRKNNKFLEVLPVSKSDIIKSQFITSFIITMIFLVVCIIIFFLGDHRLQELLQSLGVSIIIFSVALVKLIEFNIEENSIGKILKNIQVIIPVTIIAITIVAINSQAGVINILLGERVFNMFLISSIFIFIGWFLIYGKKYYMKLKLLEKQYN